MPIDRALEYLKSHKSLAGKRFEVYVGLVVGQAEQVIVKREQVVYMDYPCFIQYLLTTKRQRMALGYMVGLLFFSLFMSLIQFQRVGD